MKLPEKKTEMVFRDHYFKLSDDQKKELRKRVIQESDISYTTFYNKLKFNTFKPLEMKLINRIMSNLDY